MRVAGLSHLSAVSGANVTIVCGGVLLLVVLLRGGRRTGAVLAAAALAALVVVARPEPSVLRAAVMGSVGLWAWSSAGAAAGRLRSAWPSWQSSWSTRGCPGRPGSA
jgi:competence protein ComEC